MLRSVSEKCSDTYILRQFIRRRRQYGRWLRSLRQVHRRHAVCPQETMNPFIPGPDPMPCVKGSTVRICMSCKKSLLQFFHDYLRKAYIPELSACLAVRYHRFFLTIKAFPAQSRIIVRNFSASPEFVHSLTAKFMFHCLYQVFSQMSAPAHTAVLRQIQGCHEYRHDISFKPAMETMTRAISSIRFILRESP